METNLQDKYHSYGLYQLLPSLWPAKYHSGNKEILLKFLGKFNLPQELWKPGWYTSMAWCIGSPSILPVAAKIPPQILKILAYQELYKWYNVSRYIYMNWSSAGPWHGEGSYTTLAGLSYYNLAKCFMQPTPPPPVGRRLGVGCFREMTVRPPRVGGVRLGRGLGRKTTFWTVSRGRTIHPTPFGGPHTEPKCRADRNRAVVWTLRPKEMPLFDKNVPKWPVLG